MLSEFQNPTKTRQFQKRREEITGLIQTVGLWNINKTELAKKYGVRRDAIYNDLRHILERVSKRDLGEVRFNLLLSFKKSISECQKMLVLSGDDHIKIKAANVIANLSTKFTEMLEAYGLKEKTPDKQEVKNEVVVRYSIPKWAKKENNGIRKNP